MTDIEHTGFQACGKYVIVRETKPSSVTKGGIIIPQGLNNSVTALGTIVSAGKEFTTRIVKGLEVCFLKLSTMNIEINDEKLLVVRAEDILLIFE